MDSTERSPNPEVTRPWAPTRWLSALVIAGAVALVASATGPANADPTTPGRAERAVATAPAPSPGLLEHVLATGRTAAAATSATSAVPSTTTTAAPAPAAPDPTLPTPEAAPDPAERRPISVMGRIAIPTIGLSADLRDQITQESIDLGPSHWPGTAAPGGFGNVVIGGHRTLHTAPFHDVGELHPGDPIVLTDTAGREFTYRVTETLVVQPDAMWIVDQTPGHTLTIFTCHPIGSAAQRLVIRATLS